MADAPAPVAAPDRLAAAVATLATRLGRPPAEVAREVDACLHELRTGDSPRVARLFARAGRALLALGYGRVDYDEAQVGALRALLARQPAALLASHRSYLDGGALTVGFAERGLPRPTEFVGINLAFWPFGAIWRRAGGIFLRRGDGDPVYKLALREALARLVESRRHLRWFIEGSRTRTGKLGPPRLGLLAYLVDAWRNSAADDLWLVPVSVSYDLLYEVGEFAGEARGGAKQAESLGWLWRYVRGQRGQFGAIHVRFGRPLSLAAAAAAAGPAGPDVAKLAFEVCWRIDEATPLTGSALAAVALLGSRGHALSVTEIRHALAPYLADARRRGLPLAPSARLDDEAAVARVLAALVRNGVVLAEPGGRWRVRPGAELDLAYYRNSAVHCFVHEGLAELALLEAAAAPAGRRAAAVHEAAWALRDALKFEFFFRERDEFHAALAARLDELAPDWRVRVEQGDEAVQALLARLPVLASDMMLRSFLEAQWLLAVALLAEADAAVATRGLAERCVAAGQQALAAGELRAPEAVSLHLLRAAVQQAGHRGLLGAGRAAERQAWHAQLGRWLGHMRSVHRIAVARVAAAAA